MRPTCKICEDPRGAREVVNQMLAEGKFLRDVARQCGFSKSSVHRHSEKCVLRSRAATLKSGAFDPDRDRILLERGGTVSVWHDPSGHGFDANGLGISVLPSGVRENDWTVVVSYAAPLPEKPALKESEPATKSTTEI